MARKVTPEMWVRRVVSSLILLAVLVGLVFVAVKAVRVVHGKLADQQQQMQLAEQNLPTVVRECGSSDLEVTVTPEASTVLVGEGFAATVRISGKAEEACSFDSSELNLQLKTGDKVVWSPTKCSSSWGRPLLLGAGSSWERQVRWRGNLYSGCEALTSGDNSELIADPGTYTFGGTLLGLVMKDLASVKVEY